MFDKLYSCICCKGTLVFRGLNEMNTCLTIMSKLANEILLNFEALRLFLISEI